MESFASLLPYLENKLYLLFFFFFKKYQNDRVLTWKNVFGILRTDVFYACLNSPYETRARILGQEELYLGIFCVFVICFDV